MSDAHALRGHLSVAAAAGRVRHYRYVEERLMRTLGGWIALTPELPAKLLLGRHVWDCAQHADLWGRRLPELRAPAQRSEPANENVARFMDRLAGPEAHGQTIERLVGVYRVLKPHLIAVYGRHLGVANPVYEPPTRRILARCIDDERRHVAHGIALLVRLTRDPPARERAARWERELMGFLEAAGGVAGDGVVDRVTPTESPDDPAPAEPAPTFDAGRIPADLLAEVQAQGDAVVRGDLEAVRSRVADSAREAVLAEYARVVRPLDVAEVVACARIGEYRVVKLRFAGPRGLAIMQLEWRRGPEGWVVVAGELARQAALEP